MEQLFNSAQKDVVKQMNIDTSLLKISIMGVLGVVLATVGGYFLKLTFDAPSLINLIYATVAISGFLIIFLYQSLFIKSFSVNWWIILAESLGLASFFVITNFKFSWGILITWFSLVVIMQAAGASGIKSLSNQLKIRFTTVAKSVIPLTVSGIALFVALIFANNIYYSQNQILTSDQVKVVLSSIIEPSLKKAIPNSSINEKIGDLIWSSILTKLSPQFTKEQIDASKKDLIYEVFKPIQDQAESFGITVHEEDTVEKIISNTSKSISEKLNKKYSETTSPIKIAYIAAVVFILFLTIKFTASLIYLLLYPLAYLFFEILIAFNFIRINYIPQSKEIIVL